ncbi:MULTISPECIES: TetR/AcrR family transcriptional regulator [Bacillaceae]|uniref:TetR/AcrR family transcriptional regulator n=1 Tax=Bacillaceae TaxID=186817 RepID=UPI001BDF05D2|nr:MULTISPECIES: TetR/AcrR family transcriptional regulator [Bacillaceae]MDX8362574.1 TetR/AcrR family transcriptional regulator [Cytobacillus sp. IB215316]MDX8367025.1 TetR/AcrR family transcriptional regulator [Cytobacillus sp. IB215665]
MKTTTNILKSARYLFRDKGYEKTSIEDITEMSDIAKSTFFKHFPNKESLLIGIAEEEVADLLDLMDDPLYKSSQTIEKIRTIMLRLLEDSLPYLQLTGRVVFSSIINKSDKETPYLQIRRILENLIRESQEKGEIKATFSQSEIVTLIMGSYYGLLFRWLEEDSKVGATSELDHILDMIFKGITEE